MSEPGDLIAVGEVTISYYCKLCGYGVGVRHTQYNAGIASPLEETPLSCPGCHNEVVWLTGEDHDR